MLIGDLHLALKDTAFHLIPVKDLLREKAKFISRMDIDIGRHE